MNFALSQLWQEKYNNYEAFFLITNDTELEKKFNKKTFKYY